MAPLSGDDLMGLVDDSGAPGAALSSISSTSTPGLQQHASSFAERVSVMLKQGLSWGVIFFVLQVAVANGWLPFIWTPPPANNSQQQQRQRSQQQASNGSAQRGMPTPAVVGSGLPPGLLSRDDVADGEDPAAAGDGGSAGPGPAAPEDEVNGR
jgi:hypothetical protein